MSKTKESTLPAQAAIKSQLERLKSASSTLNESSDLLTKHVARLESIFNSFNLGVEARVQIESWSEEDGYGETWQLAYCKTRTRKWGFMIELTCEQFNSIEAGSFESWPFKDAPRDARLKAVEKIPSLLAALVEKADEVAGEISAKSSYAQSLISSLSALAAEETK